MVFYLAAIEGVFHKSFKKKKKKSSFTEMESEDSFFLTIIKGNIAFSVLYGRNIKSIMLECFCDSLIGRFFSSGLWVV